MKRLLLGTATALLALPALAQDFSEGSKAKEWNVFGVEKARFEAKVTDAVCALTGDCPDDCGAGLRQMALVRSVDGVLLLANKNIQPAFTGANIDLAEYCNQTVVVDGTLVGDADITPSLGAKLYQIQTVTPAGSDKAEKTNLWTKDWAKKYPEAKGKGPWFRRDPRIKAQIEATGYLGLGEDADKTYIEENF